MRVSAISLVLVLLAGGSAGADPNFETPAFDLGREARFIVAADFDRDGRHDVAVAMADSREHCVAVILGRQPEMFGPPTCYPIGRRPINLAVADFNRDGSADLAVGDDDANRIGLLLGNGDGTLRDGGGFAAQSPASIAVGDFDGDGLQDVAAVNADYDHYGLNVHRGAGDGTFLPAIPVSVGGGPERVAAADFDRDGVTDLALTDYVSNDVQIYLGGASFTLRQRLAAGLDPRELVITDFDGDGSLDIATSNVVSEDLSVFLGKGHGTFGAEIRTEATLPDFVSPLTSGDFNADGKADLVVPRSIAGETAILLGDGAGGFTFAPLIRLRMRGAVTADFSNDGIPDLAAIVLGEMAVFRGFGNGTFAQPARLDTAQSFYSTAIHDFNADGRPDIASADEFEGSLHVLLGLGDGSFAAPAVYAPGDNPFVVASGDFNGDGRSDLVSLGRGPAHVLLARADGSFGLPSPPIDVGVPARAAATADLNGDGRTDLVVTGGGVFGTPEGGIAVLLGRGDGTFQDRLLMSGGDFPQDLAVADLNRDGRQDLVLANDVGFNLPGYVSVLFGAGDGTFAAPLRFGVGEQPIMLAIGDLNGDGILDLATPNNSFEPDDSYDASYLIGLGDGTFAPESRIKIGGYSSATMGDFDGDGRDDLVVAASHTTIYTFKPAGLEPLPQRWLGFGWTVAGADVDGNGLLDLVFGMRNQSGAGAIGGVAIHLNRASFACVVPPGGDPSICAQEVRDIAIRPDHAVGRGAGLVTWTTTHEFDVQGFNLIVLDRDGQRVQQNSVLIPCTECLTGLGSTYGFAVPKHKSGRDLYVELLHADGRVERFGPAQRK